jgi:hypothetical protein
MHAADSADDATPSTGRILLVPPLDTPRLSVFERFCPLLYAGPPALACQPLVVNMARLLRPPECPPPNAQEVLALWSSLPMQVASWLLLFWWRVAVVTFR